MPILTIYLVFLCWVFARRVSGESTDLNCKQYNTCTDCIVSSPECTWCEDIDYHIFGQPRSRCDMEVNHKQNKCKKISNPKSGFTVHLKKDPDGDAIVSPQNLTLQLRPGQQTTITVNVLTPTDFPVDLYYLTDVSRSIEKESIKRLGQLLADDISNLTSHFRLGLGVFVDKPISPYMDSEPERVARPDAGNPNSIPTFGYRNVLPLNKNVSLFQYAIEKLKSSGNIDSPEGGLDALVQVAACGKRIGWQNKEEARRVVVLTTDAGYHCAGDGLDYPSPGLVREVLLESNVVPIFAVSAEEKPTYEELARFLGNETYAETGELKQGSSSIVQAIGQAYRKIASKVTIRDVNSAGLNLRYTAFCSKGEVYENTRTCTGVELGETVSFKVSVSTSKCSDELPRNFSIKTPYGQVFLKLSYICECDCESKIKHNSSGCNLRGDLKCGVCSCQDEWAGEKCSCTKEEVGKGCPSDSSGQTCSGRGTCKCGKCYCNNSEVSNGLIYGDECECDSFSCPKDPDNGEICGGSERGDCDCGQCKCLRNWTGPSCSCSRDLESCTKNGVVCSDRGSCRCGTCVCNATLPYRGTFCDDCVGCTGTCEANRACVECRLFGTGELDKNQCSRTCKDYSITPVDKLTPNMGKQCRFLDEEDCYLTFAYTEGPDDQLKIFTQKNKDCPSEMNAIAVIVSVIGAVLAVALALLLIWRVLATIQDRRAFAQFEKEQMNAKRVVAENPIFKPTTTTFMNPMYGVKT
ncbi:Integrin beta-1 [Porites harrisoni]